MQNVLFDQARYVSGAIVVLCYRMSHAAATTDAAAAASLSIILANIRNFFG